MWKGIRGVIFILRSTNPAAARRALSKSPGNGAGTDCPGMETWYTGHELSKYQMISMEYGLKHQTHGQCRMATGCKL